MFYLIIAIGLPRHLKILQKWDFMLFTVVSLRPRTVPEGGIQSLLFNIEVTDEDDCINLGVKIEIKEKQFNCIAEKKSIKEPVQFQLAP